MMKLDKRAVGSALAKGSTSSGGAPLSVVFERSSQLKGVAFSIINHDSRSRVDIAHYKIRCESFPPEMTVLGNRTIIWQYEIPLPEREREK
jgi:hypothetical protein